MQCDSEIEWIQHLEKLHECTFTGPKLQVAKKMAYITRAKPIEHEECPLCQVVLGKPRREFVKHVGRHMEEIALMALPRENDEDSEAYSTSIESEFSPSPIPAVQGPKLLGIDSDSPRYLQGSKPIAVQNDSTTARKYPTLVSMPAQEAIGPTYHIPSTSGYLQRFNRAHRHTEPRKFRFISCSLLTIGSWRRADQIQEQKQRQEQKQEPMELVVFYDLHEACMAYYFSTDFNDYKIEYPLAYIKNISFKQDSSTHSHSARIEIELGLPPNFFIASAGGFQQCGDFTEHQQASEIKVHHLRGDARVLQDQLAMLKSSQIYQKRRSPLPSFLEDEPELPNSGANRGKYDFLRLNMGP